VIYLDNHATTPIDPRVLDAMLPYLTTAFGNASSGAHAFGWKASAGVEDAREAVAASIGAAPKEIVFTSGSTESNNLALFGAARAYRAKGEHLVVSALEHHAVLDSARELTREGFTVTVVDPDRYGVVSAEAVAAALTERTTLVSVMAANNEIGTLNPVAEIGRLCKERGVLFHTDAVQAWGKEPLDVHAMGIDLMSITAHKAYGPKGAGALFVRASSPRVRLSPLFYGGGQERGFRSGTLNVPGIVGLGAAARIAVREMDAERATLRRLRDLLENGIRAGLDGVTRNGHPERRLAGNLNVSFDGVNGEELLAELRDLAVSSGAACASGALEPSHVLTAIGVPPERAAATVRFGLGRFTTERDVFTAIETVVGAVRKLRSSRMPVP